MTEPRTQVRAGAEVERAGAGRVVTDPADLRAADPTVLIGVFDGVHRGHQALIRHGRDLGRRTVAVTFDPHPRTVVAGEQQLLCPLRRRLELLHAHGVDEVLLVRFTPALAELDAETWIEQTLRPLGTRAVVVGTDFRFGRARAGDIELLERRGLPVHALGRVGGISSERIRALLRDGLVESAARELGRPPELYARVVARDERGARLAPLEPELLVPPDGDYEVRVESDRTVLHIRRGASGEAALVLEGAPLRSRRPEPMSAVRLELLGAPQRRGH